MKIQAGQVAVVTGAASGIGRALAQALAQRGVKLALVDWNEAGLDETAESLQVPVIKRKLDVSDRVAFEAFAQSVLAQYGQVDWLFNNAGVALLQRVQDMAYDDLAWLMNINFWGVVHGTHAFLPAMLARDTGTIVNISSLYGLMAWPANSAYSAAKFAVRGYTEAMRHDLHNTGVRAVTVHPGGIQTSIVRNARFTSDDLGRTDRSKLERDFTKIAITSSAQAASIILNGLEAGRDRIIVGKDAQLLSFLTRLFPEHYFKAVRALQRFAR
jgi:NADP-dependent 3-hydroxy acid dehydrogenase YdfG